MTLLSLGSSTHGGSAGVLGVLTGSGLREAVGGEGDGAAGENGGEAGEEGPATSRGGEGDSMRGGKGSEFSTMVMAAASGVLSGETGG